MQGTARPPPARQLHGGDAADAILGKQGLAPALGQTGALPVQKAQRCARPLACKCMQGLRVRKQSAQRGAGRHKLVPEGGQERVGAAVRAVRRRGGPACRHDDAVAPPACRSFLRQRAGPGFAAFLRYVGQVAAYRSPCFKAAPGQGGQVRDARVDDDFHAQPARSQPKRIHRRRGQQRRGIHPPLLLQAKGYAEFLPERRQPLIGHGGEHLRGKVRSAGIVGRACVQQVAPSVSRHAQLFERPAAALQHRNRLPGPRRGDGSGHARRSAADDQSMHHSCLISSISRCSL